MKIIIYVYIINATLLLLHEIESAYENEWEILKLPGKITGFLLIHIPIILLIFYGLMAIERNSPVGSVLGIVFGIGGMAPFFIHKVFVRRKDRFNHVISRSIIYLNVISGVILACLSISRLS